MRKLRSVHPKGYLPKINEVLSHYKDVKGHKDMDDQLDAVKNDLTDVLNTTEDAFRLMYRYLCENDITELQINIEALKTQIAMDGLLNSDFEIE